MRQLIYVFTNTSTGKHEVVSGYDEMKERVARIKSGEDKEFSYEGIRLVEVSSLGEEVISVD